MIHSYIRYSAVALAVLLAQIASSSASIEVKPNTRVRDLIADPIRNFLYVGVGIAERFITSNGIEFMKPITIPANGPHQDIVITGPRRECFIQISGSRIGAKLVERSYDVGDRYYFESIQVVTRDGSNRLELEAQNLFHAPYGLVIVCGWLNPTIEQVEKELRDYIRFF